MTDDAQTEDREGTDGPDRASQSGHAHPGFPGASGVLFEQAMAQMRMAVTLADPPGRSPGIGGPTRWNARAACQATAPQKEPDIETPLR